MRALIDTRWAAQWSGAMSREALRRLFAAPWRSAAAALVLATMAGSAFGQGVAAPGNREIRIGVTAPYTGPASAYGVIAKVMVAYMDKVNAEGGINGRKLRLVVEDHGYDPKKAVLAAQKMVQQDKIFASLGSIGTPTAMAAMPIYLDNKVAHLLDPREFRVNSGDLALDQLLDLRPPAQARIIREGD